MITEVDYAREYTTMELPIEIKDKYEGYQLELGLEGIEHLKIGFSREQLEALGQTISEYLER